MDDKEFGRQKLREIKKNLYKKPAEILVKNPQEILQKTAPENEAEIAAGPIIDKLNVIIGPHLTRVLLNRRIND